tara:strand:+ start:9431 stop:9730 length:300 start_codon:yes stop_codon:yes gene_type:complete
MSTQPDRLEHEIETESDSESGEIHEEEPPMSGDESSIDDPEEINLDEFEQDDFISTESLLASTLMTEDGDTVCTALVSIGKQLEIQNKILVKLLSSLQK